NVFDRLKLRLSYGLSGSEAIPPYRTLAVFTKKDAYFGKIDHAGARIKRPANRNLKWETTKQLDVGLDAAFLKGDLSFSLDYYRKRTIDLLQNVQIARQTGFDSQLRNLGSIQNQGLELSIKYSKFIDKNFSWRSILNLSGNRSKVLNLGGEQFINVASLPGSKGPGERLIVGYPAPVFVGTQYLGTWHTIEEIRNSNQKYAELGGPHYKDTNDDGIISIQDYRPLGSPQPVFYGGFR